MILLIIFISFSNSIKLNEVCNTNLQLAENMHYRWFKVDAGQKNQQHQLHIYSCM